MSNGTSPHLRIEPAIVYSINHAIKEIPPSVEAAIAARLQDKWGANSVPVTELPVAINIIEEIISTKIEGFIVLLSRQHTTDFIEQKHIVDELKLYISGNNPIVPTPPKFPLISRRKEEIKYPL
jgi:hypothetical protein